VRCHIHGKRSGGRLIRWRLLITVTLPNSPAAPDHRHAAKS
jgi:hypothetical protein